MKPVLALLVLVMVGMVSTDIIYIGTESTYLYVAEFDFSGRLTLLNTYSIPNPSFLDLHPNSRFLYAVSETNTFDGRENSGGIYAYSVESEGSLTYINSVPSLGGSPCYVEVDQTGNWLRVANYMGGNYGVWGLNPQFGTIETYPISFFQDEGKGTNPDRQEGPHAHEIVADRTNSFVVVPDLGIDKWMLFDYDEVTGKLIPAVTPYVTGAPGSGPRHITFHPSLNFAYGISELTSTVTVFAVDFIKNTIVPIQTINTTPNPGPDTTAAEVQVSPDGLFLYASNRPVGRNGTIAIYTINQNTGFISTIGYADTFGQTPRFFTFNYYGEYILIANQNSNNIVVLRRDTRTGLIGREIFGRLELQQPVHILFYQ